MEQLNQPRGDANEITTHDEPVIHDRCSADAAQPVTFADAQQHNPFTLLMELRDHVLAVDADGSQPEDGRHHLTELALSAAVVDWWSRWQPITMHRALLAGASLAEVAAAAGTTEADVASRWSAWSTRQERLVINGRPSIDPDEGAAIRARIASAFDQR